MDASEVGIYGTLRLMKNVHPAGVLAVYPIDEEVVTFGRDPKCSVRLYYSSISALHAKLIFRERKAFIVVLGASGLLIDGCHVVPSGNAFLPMTVPVSNDSEIEIHKKRFVFTYPPKEIRASLLATPAKNASSGSRRKTLRLSMIKSAEVFSPRPSEDPRENLKILQSPLKPRFKSPMKEISADCDAARQSQTAHEEDEIVLVDGNHPRVVEEEKDLVILETVEVDTAVEQSNPSPRLSVTDALAESSQGRMAQRLSQIHTPQKRTPRRHPASLHRAVLIRSAQMSIMRMEIDKEEVEDEKEVEEFVISQEQGEDEDQTHGFSEISDESVQDGAAGGENSHREHEKTSKPNSGQMSSWRKSFEAVKGLGWSLRSPFSTPEPDPDEDHEDDHEDKDEPYEPPTSSDMDADDQDEQLSTVPDMISPPRRNRLLGQFMTPQGLSDRAQPGASRGPGRYSLGGAFRSELANGVGGARRVKVEPKWKVADIDVSGDSAEKTGKKSTLVDIGTGTRSVKLEEQDTTKDFSRASLTTEERKAIQQRRKSALTVPDSLFGGRIPGLGNQRLSGFASSVSSPQVGMISSPASRISTSPIKEDSQKVDESEGEEEDTQSLLEKMKRTVDDMKRRRSMGLQPAESGIVDSISHEVVQEAMDTAEQFDGNANGGQKESGEAAAGNQSMNQNQENNLRQLEGDSARNHSEFDNASRGRVHTINRVSPSTPGMESLKHLFAKPQYSINTPAIKSMRGLFRKPQIDDASATLKMGGMRDMFSDRDDGATAAVILEGVGEMFATPVAYRRQPGGKESRSEEGNGGSDSQASVLLPKSFSTFKPTSVDVASESEGSGISTTTINPSTENEGFNDAQRGDAQSGTGNAQLNLEKKVVGKARLLRARKDVVVVENEDDTRPSEEVDHTITSRSIRTKKVKTEEDAEARSEVKSKTRSSGRGKSTPVVTARVPRGVSTEPSQAVRKPRTALKTPSQNQARTRSQTPATSEQASQRTAIKSRKTVKVADDGDDPLESMDRPEQPPERTLKSGRKKATAIKKEESDGDVEMRIKTRSAAPSRTRAISTRKTVDLTSESSEQDMEKENNTPSVDGDETDGALLVGPAKGRREVLPRTIRTRATRTRTN